MVISQMLRGLVSSTAQMPATYMPVPSDNVTIAGLQSDVTLINQNEHRFSDYIGPVNPNGIVAPTSTVEPTTTQLFLNTPAMYDVFKQPGSTL